MLLTRLARPNEDPDGNEMRGRRVLTSDTQVTRRATTTVKKTKTGSKEKEKTLPLT
jgi:hypothetical protein